MKKKKHEKTLTLTGKEKQHYFKRFSKSTERKDREGQMSLRNVYVSSLQPQSRDQPCTFKTKANFDKNALIILLAALLLTITFSKVCD